MDAHYQGAHHLTGAHRRTYDALFQHPLASNLDWSRSDRWSARLRQ